MKATQFRHSHGTAPRQGLALCLLLVLLHLPSPALAQLGVEMILGCPCTIEHTGTNTVTVKAGIKNRGDTTSGRLQLYIVVSRHTVYGGTTGVDGSHNLAPLASGAAIDKDTPIEVDIPFLHSYILPGSVILPGSAIHFQLHLFEEKAGEPDHYRTWDSVEFPPVVPVMNSFGTVTSIGSPEARYLDDTDGDGVSDYNENLMGTTLIDPDSKPDAPVLYIMALYTENYAQVDTEPLATIAHHVEWANLALKNSEVGFRYQLARVRQTDHEIHPDGPLQSLAQGRRTFSGVRAEAEAAGADLVTLYAVSMELSPGRVGCGFAASDGRSLLSDDEGWGGAYSLVLVTPSCRAEVLAHELGHNLGLGHDVREDNARRGIFRWSRGHGVDEDFVTIMAYTDGYRAGVGNGRVQFFSNPNVRLCGSNNSPCGVERDKPFAANAALTLNTFMYKASRWALDPPDDDGDGVVNFFDAFDDDPMETTDTDGDKIGNNTDPDDDNDGLTDIEEAALKTNPLRADTDGDTVNDSIDRFPTDKTRAIDADNDGVDAVLDANDNDASVKWTRTRVTLTPDATVRANLIATFDDTTEGPAAIRANTTKYAVTGVFANPEENDWNSWDRVHPNVARVGEASVSTADMQGWQGTIRIKNVVIAGNYINFLMVGGDYSGMTDIGINLHAADTLLAGWKPSNCLTHVENDKHWRHLNVSALAGQSVDIEIYDNEEVTTACNSISFDHFYQSDSARGELVGTASLPDTDNDGLSDVREAALGTDPNLADTDGDGVGDGRDVEPKNVAVAYRARNGQPLDADAADARNVIADFDDLAEIRAKTAKYELTGVFANTRLTHWNRFEAEDAAAVQE